MFRTPRTSGRSSAATIAVAASWVWTKENMPDPSPTIGSLPPRTASTTMPSGAKPVPGPTRLPKRRLTPPVSAVIRSSSASAATAGRNALGPCSHSGERSSATGPPSGA